MFGGAEFDNHGQGFAFLGGDVSKAVHPNVSLAARLMPNFLTYKFRSGGDEVTAVSPGVYALFGVKGRWSAISAGLLVGVEARDTDLDPDVRDAEVRGTTVAPLVHGEFEARLPSRTTLGYFGSFSGTDSFIYQKGSIKQQLTNLDYSRPNTFNGGVEVVWGRNPDFDLYQVGLVGEVFNITRTLAVQARVGYRHDSTFGDGVYGGLSFYKGF